MTILKQWVVDLWGKNQATGYAGWLERYGKRSQELHWFEKRALKVSFASMVPVEWLSDFWGHEIEISIHIVH